MQWQFRKILTSIQSYKNGSQRFINQIEKGTPGALNTLVRQIQLIITQPNDKIITKLLSMRFAKDIMILGRQDVINQLTKLVPLMLKVCSYHLDSDDPNRGQSYFFDHPQYVNGSPHQKQQIEHYGSTYFTLNLQSIYFWAKWIPADENGNQSIYSKGLNTLFERGVKFNSTYHYYKNSDTQKFKNIYKIQFFSQDSVDFDNHSAKSSKTISDKNNQNNYENIQNILHILSTLQSSKNKRYDKLQILNKNVITLLQKKYSYSTLNSNKQKNQKKWLENFIINYNLLLQNKISYQQFIKRSTIQQIQICDKIQQQFNQSDVGFKKIKTSAKREIIKKSQTQDRRIYQQTIKKQQLQYIDQKQQFKYDINLLNKKIQQLNIQHQSQINNVIQDYQDRIKIIKQRVVNGNNKINEPLIKQNQKLKQRILDLQKYQKQSQSHEYETQNLLTAYEHLKQQNKNLKKSQIKDTSTQYYKQKIKQLQKQLSSSKINKNHLQNKIDLKTYKQYQNVIDQLNIYKNQLKNQRQNHQRKFKVLQNSYEQLEKQCKIVKDKFKTLQKKYDLKQIQIVQLNQHIKIIKEINKNTTNTNNYHSQKINSKYIQQKYSQKPIKLSNQKKPLSYFNFKKYQQLKNAYFLTDKIQYLRFCRCSLKKKDLLYKKNQLQIGLISQPFSNRQLKFILHFTNMSQHQLNQLRLTCQIQTTNDYQLSLQTQYIFCLQPNEQQKANLFCRSINGFLTQVYHPIALSINYIKNGKMQQMKVMIPFLLFKTIEQYKIDKNTEPNRNQQILLTFPYSHTLIPNPKYLQLYFPQIQQTSPNRYQCDLLYRQNRIMLRFSLQLKQQNKLGITLSLIGQDKTQQKQKQLVLHDLMGFLEFCFRR